MKIKIYFLLLIVSLIFHSCKKEETVQNPNENGWPESDFIFEGFVTLNGEEPKDFALHFNRNDTLIGVPAAAAGLSIYEEWEGKWWPKFQMGTVLLPLNDTSYFHVGDGPRGLGYWSASAYDLDAITCNWPIRNVGWCYIEQVDSTSYKVNLEGVLRKDFLCYSNGGYGDTINVSMNGVFTLNE